MRLGSVKDGARPWVYLWMDAYMHTHAHTNEMHAPAQQTKFQTQENVINN